jgi:hypothetical protein
MAFRAPRFSRIDFIEKLRGFIGAAASCDGQHDSVPRRRTQARMISASSCWQTYYRDRYITVVDILSEAEAGRCGELKACYTEIAGRA